MKNSTLHTQGALLGTFGIHEPIFDFIDAIDHIVMNAKLNIKSTVTEETLSSTVQVENYMGKNISVLPDFNRVKRVVPKAQHQWLQEWEGYIENIDGDGFTAKVKDLTNLANPIEFADFLIADLSEDDQKLLKIGAVFRWLIGYEIASGGTKSRKSMLIMRRIPALTESAIREADEEAEALRNKFTVQ